MFQLPLSALQANGLVRGITNTKANALNHVLMRQLLFLGKRAHNPTALTDRGLCQNHIVAPRAILWVTPTAIQQRLAD
jgi:hypothetical protein